MFACLTRLLNPVPECDIFRKFDGSPLAPQWFPASITAADEDDASAELRDFALLGTVPIFSLRALDVLLDLLKANGELLPLRYPRREYFAYNVTLLLPALDESASTIERVSTGRILFIDKYVFRPGVLEGVVLFTIIQRPKAFVFLTDRFVKRVKSARLTGFSFPLLWTTSTDH